MSSQLWPSSHPRILWNLATILTISSYVGYFSKCISCSSKPLLIHRSILMIGEGSPTGPTNESACWRHTRCEPARFWLNDDAPDQSTPSSPSALIYSENSSKRRCLPTTLVVASPSVCIGDVCDLGSHFATEVPCRAVQAPMVLKAVLALPARLNAILSNTSDWEASEYHGQCLELLIAALAQPENTYEENLLITVVILRLSEELEQSSDEQCHLFGSNRLLNKMSTAASSGGIAEAISWVFLRQAIYASNVQSQPMQFDLAKYER
ncbi:hypothetical protein BDV24DRAFT_62768 [Aspergillus arachidicola]|uniref:Uncharacterized protein n=1 Tax=Aspergillus arachidicola TaxID=656916 RepID=A0A5N6Y9V6_9EURO|nr:hypothetical protein BDV24DRAFT_62768 [Aspergillus arachidicola]